MAVVKITRKGIKGTKSVTLEHADAIFKLQRNKGTAKDKCWTLVKEKPEPKEDSEKED